MAVQVETPEQLANRRNLFLTIELLLGIAAYLLAPALIGPDKVPPEIYIASAGMIVVVLGAQISSELRLIKYGPISAIVVTEKNKNNFRDIRDQLDQCRRKIFKRRISGLITLLFIIPATILSTWNFLVADTQDSFMKFCIVVTAWLFLFWPSLKITNWLAVRKFGNVEKEQQQLEVAQRKQLKESIKGRRLTKKKRAIIYILGAIFGLVAIKIGAHFGMSKGLIKAITVGIIVGVSLMLSRNQKMKVVDKANE